jgi:hypothetical protein
MTDETRATILEYIEEIENQLQDEIGYAPKTSLKIAWLQDFIETEAEAEPTRQ